MFHAKRLAALLVPLAFVASACGSEKSVGLGDKTIDGWDAVSISGTPGTAPTVKWKGQMSTVESTDTKTLTEGSGDVVKKGESVNAYIWLGDGYSKKQSYSDYDNKASEVLTADSKSLSEVFEKLLVGSKIGSRQAAIASASDVFGDAGNTDLGIANEDPLLIIVDVISKAVTKPTDTTPDKVPSVVQKKGKVTGLDFTGLTKPDPTSGPFLRATIKQGSGATVTADDTVKVNYLGMVYGAKKPFDESYTKTPAEFALSSVVKGWTYGLTGVKVGSRIVLQIPPVLGYGGDTSNAAIPANSTLYFVIDVLSATPAASASASPSADATTGQ
ncbi:FKBP-type peptidyl-prolyl cis-trans isomerase [Nocardioides sp. Kera G14]|uniref:FKBP-type peptidyl-prolyl cis-trans isomerase n=1 Tax=Nocardioides sp. Kera G14 TaxID=2884264 RepID=UPI001D0FC7CF|nr:FKBP-type peptidyl-prolyl cis-trans isomerase [Nocardioides sp. Kera G14]UDY25200.1 FKBP-type peptidyl-prolyl cis-trans isomerase [Nocardioides sp. Kera G14]